MPNTSDPATVLDHLIAKAGQLYSLPAVAMEVLELTNNPQVDARALKDCIENDPALTSKLLRVVNSSLFGLSREVSDLNQTLALLGTKPLKLLVLGFSLPAGLFADVAVDILGQYWRRTLTKAVAGREISEALFGVPGDEAFIAGLLQDLGMLLLIQQLGEPYIKFLERVAGHGKDLAELETESMGFEHTQVSSRLLAMWGLPEILVNAVAWDSNAAAWDALDEPAADATVAEKSLPQIIRLAELFARLLADEQPGALQEILQAGRQYADLTEERLESLATDLGEKVGQLADVLSLQLPGGLDYRDVLVRAHEQLSAVAAETAEELVCASRGGATALEEVSALAEIQVLADAVAAITGQSADSSSDTGPSRPTPKPADTHAEPSTRPKPCAVATADPGLLGRLEAAVAACRQMRCPLSLLLIQFDDVDELIITRGVEGFSHLRQMLSTVCEHVEHPGSVCVPQDDTCFALVLPDCERRQALELGTQLIDTIGRVRPVGMGDHTESRPPGLSAGVATVSVPPKNFPAGDLLAGAQRCLRGSRASGGGVKSIEIY